MDVEQIFSEYEPLSQTPVQDYVFCMACGGKLAKEHFYGLMRQRCTDCRRVQYANPYPGVEVLVVDGDRFLLCRRSRTTSVKPGGWCLPGGHIEWNEDFLTAAIREVREEAGLEVEIDSILTVYAYFFDSERHYHTVTFLGHAVAGLPKGDNIETDAARWFSKHEALPDLAFPGQKHIIERYFEAPFTGAPVDLRLRHTT
jgi:ADP-ribose pyrophosphatase YjhB (NUDIX family)